MIFLAIHLLIAKSEERDKSMFLASTIPKREKLKRSGGPFQDPNRVRRDRCSVREKLKRSGGPFQDPNRVRAPDS